MDWDEVKQYNFAHHVHAKGRPYEDVIDKYELEGTDHYHALQFDDRTNAKRPVWPWQAHGRDPKRMRLYNVPGSESFGRVNHFVWLWSFYQHDDRDYAGAFKSAEPGALAYLAHPSRLFGTGVDAEYSTGLQWITQQFKEHEQLRGLAVLNHFYGAYQDKDFRIWHDLLVHFGPRRPVFGYAEADSLPARFDVRYDRVLARSLPAAHPDTDGDSPEHETEFKHAWGKGRTFWVNNGGPGVPPRVTRIVVKSGKIQLDVDGDYDSIQWKYGAETIAEGDVLDLSRIDASKTHYVRFEIWEGNTERPGRANIVGSQPFYLLTAD